MSTFIVAELSANHLGSLGNAHKLIDAAARAGANAIKLQCYDPDSLTLCHDSPHFRVQSGPWKGRMLHSLYREAMTPWEWFDDLFLHAENAGLMAFSSVFCKKGVDFLEALDCPIYKISSFEITDIPLIEYAAATQKDMIISTGMASDEEIEDAVRAHCSLAELTLLHCVSSYPTNASQANLRRMDELQEWPWSLSVGLSDHTLSTCLPAVAVALGAKVIEKHLCLARSLGGPDADFSLEPDEFTQMVENVREAERALETPAKSAEPHRDLRRSLYAVQDIAKGDIFTEDNVRSIRPGHGLAPKYLPEILGTQADRNFPLGTPITKG